MSRFMVGSVAALGLVSTILLISDPPPHDDLAQASTPFDSRHVASINSMPEAVFSLRCDQSEQHFETSKARFRLRGGSCLPNNESPIATQIHNKSNGYVATVFHPDSQEFTTDFINLNKGDNEIEITFQTDQGQVKRQLVVERDADDSSNSH